MESAWAKGMGGRTFYELEISEGRELQRQILEGVIRLVDDEDIYKVSVKYCFSYPNNPRTYLAKYHTDGR